MARYSVSGTLSPDATVADTGEAAGEHNGQPYWSWTNDAGTWYLWSSTVKGVISWYLSPTLGSSMWTGPASVGATPNGDYLPPRFPPGITGTASVAEYVEPSAPECITLRWRASGEFTILKMR